MVEHEEALCLLETEKLQGRGLGWIDIHLLASARLQNVRIWSLDKALVAAAEKMGISDI